MALLPEYAAHPAGGYVFRDPEDGSEVQDRKSTRLNSSHRL